MTSKLKPTIQRAGNRPPVDRGPAPVVCFGSLLCDPRHPGVMFVFPYHAEVVGGPQSDLGWSIPMVVVTADLTVDQVMEAALFIGDRYRIKQQMRQGVRDWAKSIDWRKHPHRCPSEWPTDVAS